MNCITLDEIKDKLDFFNKMYDAVRLVDPVHKRVLDYRNASLAEAPDVCYEYWENGKICDNCISIRAYHENTSFVKLEKNSDTVYLVTAVPVENACKPAILELLKNATETMLIGSGTYHDGKLFRRFVGEMNDMIVRDALTSLYNRRFVSERLPVDVINAALKNQPLSVCFFDLDNFKIVNDFCGHEAGDVVLKAVGDVILRNIRSEQDWAARYGGDEFILCLSDTGKEQARTVAARIKSGIEKIPTDLPPGSPRLSASFGIETLTEFPLTAEELIRRADQNMYREKGIKT